MHADTDPRRPLPQWLMFRVLCPTSGTQRLRALVFCALLWTAMGADLRPEAPALSLPRLVLNLTVKAALWGKWLMETKVTAKE